MVKKMKEKAQEEDTLLIGMKEVEEDEEDENEKKFVVKAAPSGYRVLHRRRKKNSFKSFMLGRDLRVTKGPSFFRQETLNRFSRNLPSPLLKHHQKVHLDKQPFTAAFGPKTRRKRPCLLADDYQSLAKKAHVAQATFDNKNGASGTAETTNEAYGFRVFVRHSMFEKGQNKHVLSELYKVIDNSDVLVQVLDARDPQGTRFYHLEKYLKENCKYKRMLLLLNKCDLIPAWATKGWLRVLSKQYPTLAFHARINKSFGKDSLLSVLRQFACLKRDNRTISVGFIGYPNVGKSSVINTLLTKNVCKVSPIPGETKVRQSIILTKGRISLIDCPGVVYQKKDSETDVVLKGLVHVTNLKDAADHIGEVLKLVMKEHLHKAYKIKEWENENDFLHQLCKLTGKLLKGGEPDLMTAAKMVLHDLQRGKVPFFVPPPLQEDLSEESNVNGIDFDDVDSKQASAAIQAIRNVLSSQLQRSVPVHKYLFTEELEEEADDDLFMISGDNTYENVLVETLFPISSPIKSLF